MPVHFAERPMQHGRALEIRARHGLKMIEDCAPTPSKRSITAAKRGTFGDFGCFSFYASKNVTTAKGGMVVTRNEEDLARIKMLGAPRLSKDAWNVFSDEGYSIISWRKLESNST